MPTRFYFSGAFERLIMNQCTSPSNVPSFQLIHLFRYSTHNFEDNHLQLQAGPHFANLFTNHIFYAELFLWRNSATQSLRDTRGNFEIASKSRITCRLISKVWISCEQHGKIMESTSLDCQNIDLLAVNIYGSIAVWQGIVFHAFSFCVNES